MQVEVNPLRLEVAEEPDEILETATQPIDGPRGRQVDLLAGDRA
jgi:hypothetical protein